MNENSKNDRVGIEPELPLPRKGNMILVLAMIAILLAIMLGMADVAKAQSPQPAGDHPAEVTTKVSKSDAQIAEPIWLELIVNAPADYQVYFPMVGDQLGKFDVVSHHDLFDIPLADNVNLRSWTRKLELESINTGNLEIPAIQIQVTDGVSTDTISSTPIPVRIASVLEDRADPTQFRDIRSVVDVHVPVTKSNAWMWWTVGGAGVVALALASVALIARRKTYLTPTQWALSELDQLAASELAQHENAEPVLTAVSTILRDYLHLQFEISAPVQTTKELVEMVENSPVINGENAKQFGKLLLIADQAKFAGLELTADRVQQVIDSARQLVESTTISTLATQVTEPHQSSYAENQ